MTGPGRNRPAGCRLFLCAGPGRRASREAARKLSRHRAVRRLCSLQEIAGGQDHSRLCWSHLRREFFKIAERGDAPIATEAVARIAQIYVIEKDVRGTSAEERRAARQARWDCREFCA